MDNVETYLAGKMASKLEDFSEIRANCVRIDWWFGSSNSYRKMVVQSQKWTGCIANEVGVYVGVGSGCGRHRSCTTGVPKKHLERRWGGVNNAEVWRLRNRQKFRTPLFRCHVPPNYEFLSQSPPACNRQSAHTWTEPTQGRQRFLTNNPHFRAIKFAQMMSWRYSDLQPGPQRPFRLFLRCSAHQKNRAMMRTDEMTLKLPF